MFTESLDTYLKDFGVEVISGNNIFKGILDMPDEVVTSEGLLISTEFQLVAKTEDVSSLGTGSVLTIDDVNYIARTKPKKFDDGRFSRVFLSEAS